jgi:archaellum component FlaC
MKTMQDTLSVDARFDRIENRFQDVLDALNEFSTSVDRRFDEIDERFKGVDRRFDGIDERLKSVDRRFDEVAEQFKGIDRRFDAIQEDLGTLNRKSNTKLTVLVDSLVAEKALDAKTAKRILALEPYPQS